MRATATQLALGETCEFPSGVPAKRIKRIQRRTVDPCGGVAEGDAPSGSAGWRMRLVATPRVVRVHCASVVRERVVLELPASCEAAFDLVHDYARRLEWDTLLRAAFIEGGAAAGLGAVAVCSGRWWLAGLTMRTVYVSFRRGTVAAVRMVNRPLFFARWAASIRHESLGERRSRITYTYSFRARPASLAFLLEPMLARLFRWETRRRLQSLRAALLRPSRS